MNEQGRGEGMSRGWSKFGGKKQCLPVVVVLMTMRPRLCEQVDGLKEIIPMEEIILISRKVKRSSTCEIICFDVEITKNDGRLVWKRNIYQVNEGEDTAKSTRNNTSKIW